ncbi:MAG: hypothetical protein DRQ44_16355, partial [Gammaproteobacteria bacterium]
MFEGNIGAPYIIQDTSDGDFTLEVKFDSMMPAADFAEQGIIIRQDDLNWLRLEFYSRADDSLNILAGLPHNLGFPTNQAIPGVSAGASPMYMRIQRAGDTWTQSYSTDGTSWISMLSFDHPLTVTGVGVYAGNAGDNPQHTVLVDYFSNSLTPIVEPDDTGLNILTTSVVGNGTIDRLPDDPEDTAYNCGDMIQLTANPGSGYVFDSWSGDVTGSVSPVTVTMNGPMSVTANFILSGPADPVAVDDNFTVVTGSTSDLDILANDTDVDGTINPATVFIVTAPTNGTIDSIDPATGFVTYSHGGGMLGDSFTYNVEDNDGNVSNDATVLITVDAPTAADDVASVLFNGIVDVDVLSNDTAGIVAIDPATVNIVVLPANGNVNVDGITGLVTYTHTGIDTTNDSFTYTVDDINGVTSNIATVSVTVNQIPAGQFVSDDFNACDLNPVWTFVDPQGDATAPTIQGAFTGDAKVAITVPSGGAHELFEGNIGAPYIIQETTDTDFTLDVKFDSVLPVSNYAMQGIIVRQDDSEWLRLEFYSTNTDEISILAGLPDIPMTLPVNEVIPGLPAGASPMYMRVQRAGDTWTQSHSTDGTSWTPMASFDYALTVTGVGLYGGNAVANPQHTVLVDYFSNSLAPIVEPDDTGLNDNILTTTVTGDGVPGVGGTIVRAPDLAAYGCGDLVQLTPNPELGFIFDSWSGDVTGSANPLTVTMNGPMSVVANFITSTPADPVANDDNFTVAFASTSDLDILANDTDADGIDPTTVVVVTGPTHGTHAINPVTGIVTYTHDGLGMASDSFTYNVRDNGDNVSNDATVLIVIDAPTAVDDLASVLFNDTVDVNVLTNDTQGIDPIDPTSVFIVALPANGTAVANPTTGVVTYTHTGLDTTNDSFTYTVNDINGGTSNIATVSVTVGQIPAG